MTFKQWWDGAEWSLGTRFLFKPLAQLFAEIAWNAAVADERKACAKVCEEQWEIDGTRTAQEFATAIRARGDDAP